MKPTPEQEALAREIAEALTDHYPSYRRQPEVERIILAALSRASQAQGTRTQEAADIEAGRASISALRDEAREYGRMPFKVRDMHVHLLHRLLDRVSAAHPPTRAPEGDWQPIETAPKVGVFLGAWHYGGRYVRRIGFWSDHANRFVELPSCHIAPFAIWTPLPEPPEWNMYAPPASDPPTRETREEPQP